MNKEELEKIKTQDDYSWIKVKQYVKPSDRWYLVADKLPQFGEVCEIRTHWAGMGPEQRTRPFIFVERVGADGRTAFQDVAYNANGLDEEAFFIDENIVSHWRVHETYALEQHHKAETEFLINKCRELAAQTGPNPDGSDFKLSEKTLQMLRRREAAVTNNTLDAKRALYAALLDKGDKLTEHELDMTLHLAEDREIQDYLNSKK